MTGWPKWRSPILIETDGGLKPARDFLILAMRSSRVGPVVLVMQIVIPVLLAPLVGGERWGAGGPVLALALVVVAGGVALLASSRAIGELEHERGRGGESGEGEILRLPRGERAPERGGKAGA